MDKVFISSVFLFGISRTIFGSPSLTCNDADPSSTSTLQCSCYNPGGQGIIWHRDGTYLTQCTLLNEHCFTSVGYMFAANSSTSTYTIDVHSYSYTDCSSVSCSDSITPTNSDLKTVTVDESSLNTTISTINEPSANHTSGNISFTTDCLYKARSTNISVSAKWTAVTGSGEHVLKVDETISKIGSCQSCSYDFASKYMVEFYHKEDQSGGREEAKIRLELLIDGNSVSSLRKTTNNFYFVKVKSDSTSDNSWICIIIIVPCILAVYVIVHAIILICKCEVLTEKKGLECCCLFVPAYGLFKIFRINCNSVSGCQSVVDPSCKEGKDPSSLLEMNLCRPDFEVELEILEVNEKSINIGWKRCNDMNFNRYQLKYAEAERQKTIYYHGGEYIEFTLSDLNESTSYNFSLSCLDDHKLFDELHRHNVRIDEPCDNDEFSINRVSKRDIIIIWKCGAFDKVRTFTLTYSGNIHEKVIMDDGKGFKSYTLSELNEATPYILELSCIDKSYKEMKRIKSKPVRVRTKGCPEPPKNFEVTKIRGEIVAKWAPGYDGGHQQHFVLIDAVKQKQITEPFRSPFQKVIMYTIPILQNITHLKLQVLSVNSKGTSESSIVEVEL